MPAQPIPSVFRPSGFGVALQNRPHTLAELSEMATTAAPTVDSNIPIARYLIGSETLAKQAESFLKQDRLDDAFVALVKNCKLLIENLPNQHRGYKTLDSETKGRLRQKGQWNLDQLSQVKVKVVDRFEAWRSANPDAPIETPAGEAARRVHKDMEREAQRPIPSTGVMEQPRKSIDYVKPSRSSAGFDVRDLLGGPSSSGSRNAG